MYDHSWNFCNLHNIRTYGSKIKFETLVYMLIYLISTGHTETDKIKLKQKALLNIIH
jgi:hypothetical protein